MITKINVCSALMLPSEISSTTLGTEPKAMGKN